MGKSSKNSKEKEPRPKRSKHEKDNSNNEDDAAVGTGSDISLSISETNKLREKLGLAPLQLDDKPKIREDESGTSKEKVYTKEGVEFVHRPAKNQAELKAEENLREKLAAAKEKRKIQEKLSSVKALGASENDVEGDSAASWVEKSRKLEQEKVLALQRAKILEEMDKDFGVGDMINQQIAAKKEKAYSSKDLKGLTVQHSLEEIAQGSETILVLKDKDVLDESDEILINPTLAEHEQWSKNADIRKKKPGYDPYEDDFDEFGNFKEKKLLGKYDEEIDGEEKKSFKLGSHGSIDADYEKIMADRMKAKLREGFQNLEMAPSQLASEYYTKEEMAKFKKPKKKKVLRRKGEAVLKPDDLLNAVEEENADFGSRNRGKGKIRPKYEEGEIEDEEKEKHDKKKPGIDLSRLNDNFEESDTEHYEDLTGIVIEDDAENELQSVLHRSRIIKQLEKKPETIEKQETGAEFVIKNIKKEEPEAEMDQSEPVENQSANDGNITLNAISEYCRGLGDIPTYGLAGNRDDIDPTDMYYQENSKIQPSYDSDIQDLDEDDLEPTPHKRQKMSKSGGKWVQAEFDEQDRMSTVSSNSSDEETEGRPAILEEEPVAGGGVAAALKLAQAKGYLERGDNGDHGPSKLAHLEAQRFTIVDKQFHDIDDKYAKKLERMGGHGGPITEFKEKSTYQPKVKLEYSDERGNLMDPKEAFRYMSWKFHGKCPGKRKVEKRVKKTTEKQLIHKMSSTDTPLGTLGKQIDKQKQLHLPYIVLSGAGSKDVGTSIKKE